MEVVGPNILRAPGTEFQKLEVRQYDLGGRLFEMIRLNWIEKQKWARPGQVVPYGMQRTWTLTTSVVLCMSDQESQLIKSSNLSDHIVAPAPKTVGCSRNLKGVKTRNETFTWYHSLKNVWIQNPSNSVLIIPLKKERPQPCLCGGPVKFAVWKVSQTV